MRVEVKGADKAAGDLKKVDQAQKGVGKTTTAQTKGLKEATEAQKKLNASESDYTELLSRIHPALGAVAMASVKATKIAGDLATQQINLGGVLRKTSGAIKANAKALLLVGAGGAVFAAIAALVTVWGRLKESVEESTRALSASTGPREEAIKHYREMAKAIREVANARERLAKMDVAESEATQRQAAGIAQRFRAVDPQAAATLLAEYHGVGLSEKQLTALVLAQAGGAQGLAPKPGMGPDYARLHAERKLREERTQAAIGAATKESQELQRQQTQDLFRQAQAGQGEAIEAFVAQLAPGQERVQKRILKLLRAVGGTEGGLRAGYIGTAPSVIGGVFRGEGQVGRLESQVDRGYWGGAQYLNVSERELSLLTTAVNNLSDLMKSQGSDFAFTQGPAIGIQINNGPDAAARQSRETYGAEEGRRLGEH